MTTDCDNHAATVTSSAWVRRPGEDLHRESITRCATCHAAVTLPEPEEPK